MSLQNIANLGRGLAAQQVKEGGYLSEFFGNIPIAGGLAGAGLGAYIGADGLSNSPSVENAILGGLGGMYAHQLANLAGAGSALATPTRDAEDQRKADETGLLNFLPGVSGYNLAKRLGYSIRNPELGEGKANKIFPGGKEEKEKEEKEAASASLGRVAAQKQAAINYKSITPGNTAAVGALLGGGLGALGGAGSTLLGSDDEEDKPSALNRALLGLIAGGGMGAAGGYLGAPALQSKAKDMLFPPGARPLDGTRRSVPSEPS